MKRSRLLLILCLLLLPLQAATGLTLDDLGKDAQSYRKELLAKRIGGSAEELAQLRGAARIMAESKECSTAVALRHQLIRMGGQVDEAAWRGLQRDAVCARDWTEASRAGWLALHFGKPVADPLQAWADLGNALEARSSWSDDWKPAALEAYNKVLESSEVPWVRAKVTKLIAAQEEADRLAVDSTRVDTEAAAPALCFDFNDHMAGADEVQYGDYFRFEPSFDAVYKTGWSEVCAHGAAYGVKYQVRVLQGLKGEDYTLDRHLELTVDSGQRPPALWFDRSAYVLAAGGALETPLHVINTAKSQLRLLRIHERNILTPFVQDNFQGRLSGYQLEQVAETLGEEVWRGEVDTAGASNQDHLAWIRLPESVGEQPGLYVLAAREAEEDGDWQERATQWLVVSDIGLTSYRGDDGLTVVARRLSDARAVAGVEMTLLARNNQPLANLKTGADGMARFAPGLLQGEGGRRAAQLTALATGLGFTFLELDKPAFDLSDRGVDGRMPPGPLDAYLYTERGVYRPGETVNLVALLRDNRGRAVNDLPMTLKLRNPSGDPVLEQVLAADDTGAYVSSLHIAEGARTGKWKVTLHADPDAPGVGVADFLVEQVVPPRMEAELTADAVLQPGTPGEAELSARYLFGAPAAERPVRAELFVEADPNPFPEYAEYRFGMDGESVESDWIDLPETVTDEQGKARLQPLVGDVPPQRVPLRARVRAEVMDVDGRIVAAETRLPIRHLPLYLGVSPQFEGQAKARSDAAFRVIALDEQGVAVARGGLRWRLVAEEWDYQWFRKNGNWAYERVLVERPSGEGIIALGAAPDELTMPVGQGDYRLEIEDPEASVAAVYRFRAGEQILGSYDTPDAVKVTLDRPDYLPGDRARIEFESPFEGVASLVIAGESIHSVREIPLDGVKGAVEIPVSHDWGAGAYALITIYRPGTMNEKGAGRAIGVAWIGVRPQQHRLTVELMAPEVVRPRQTIEVPVQVRGISPGEQVRLTLAAVDEGVLSLTDFASPDPLAHFFGKRRLGVDVVDLYGRLIARRGQRPDHLRAGAGTSGRRGMPPSNVEIVSLFTGTLAVDAQGMAMVSLELPDFNGRLRLMAVAWSRDKLGAVDGPLTVRDPVVVMPSLPRFLALEDQGELNVLLNNMGGPEGEYRLSARGDAVVAVEGESERIFSLAAGERRSERFPLRAAGLGAGWLELHLEGPEGYSYQRRLKLGVRGRFLPVVERRYQKLAPGEEIVLDGGLTQGLFPATAGVTLTLSPHPALDVKGLIAELKHYPYGCLEQLTSRGLPMLYANSLAERWGGEVDPNRPLQLGQTVQLLLDKQLGSGAFALWSNRGDEEIWLSPYVMDFLTQARQQGIEVSDYFYERGLEWLTDLVGSSYLDEDEYIAAKAYAHYVLASAGRSRPEEARYLLDTRLESLPSPLAAAQLGAAMALQGDRARASKAFQRALRSSERKSLWSDYGSRIRDIAAVIALVEESGGLADTATAWQDLMLKVEKRRWLSTQEKAWLIRAARTLPAGDMLHLSLGDGDPVEQSGEYVLALEGDELKSGRRIRNRGDQPLWAAIGIQGTPVKLPQREDLGFGLQRDWYNLEGEVVDPLAVEQGELLMAVIRGRVNSGEKHRALVVDLLPAGLEIENPQLADALDPQDFSWLPELTPSEYVDALDDRFVAALDAQRPSGKRKEVHFTLAYLLRAVTPGEFFVSPAEVEDMYTPRFRANTPPGEIRILAR